MQQRNLEESQDEQKDVLSSTQAVEAEQLLDMEDEGEAIPITNPAATLSQGQQVYFSIPILKATQSLRPTVTPERDCTYVAIKLSWKNGKPSSLSRVCAVAPPW